MNKCIKCGIETRYSYKKMCRKCYRALPENKAKENAYSRKWYARNRESEIASNREYRKQNRELFNWYHNKQRFGGVKRLVLERDKNRCQSCGTSKALVVHHLDGTNVYKGNANNGLENLIVLCSSCHGFLHQHQRRTGKDLTREDIVQTLAKAKEVWRKSHPLRKKSKK